MNHRGWQEWSDWSEGRSSGDAPDWISEWIREAQRKAARAGRGGPPPWVAGLVGLMGHQQGPPPPRARRGDVRSAILDVLSRAGAESLNGYQVIQQITDYSGGAWKPSPGSVYPTIQQLTDEGLIEAEDDHGRRTLRLTADGRGYVTDHAAELAQVWAPFAATGSAPSGDYSRLRPELGHLVSGVWQVVTTGTDRQRHEAIEVLAEARKRIYGLLAEDAPTEETEESR